MNTVYHSNSSAKKFGGLPEDYQAIHNWFDESKSALADARHRMARHHAFGIFECEKLFGEFITNSDGKRVPTRLIGEQHVREDCGGRIPSLQDWASELRMKSWMNRTYSIDQQRMLTSRDDHTYEDANASSTPQEREARAAVEDAERALEEAREYARSTKEET